jgi:hypothetical protein
VVPGQSAGPSSIIVVSGVSDPLAGFLLLLLVLLVPLLDNHPPVCPDPRSEDRVTSITRLAARWLPPRTEQSRMTVINPAPTPGAQKGIIMRYELFDVSGGAFYPSLEQVSW